jgi:hypothetical protein
MKPSPITAENAIAMPRFEFIALWLVETTRKKSQRPMGKHVVHTRGVYKIMSPIGGGVTEYETTDPALLFDYARRGVLGPLIRDADDFRSYAHQELESRGERLGISAKGKTPAQLDREIAEALAKVPKTKAPWNE